MQASKRSFADRLEILSSIKRKEQEPELAPVKINEQIEVKDIQFELDLSIVRDAFNDKAGQLRDAASQTRQLFVETTPPLIALNKVAKTNNVDSFDLLKVFEARYGEINDVHQAIVDRKFEQTNKLKLQQNFAEQIDFLQILSGIK